MGNYNVVIILNKIQHTCILIGQMIHSLNDFALSPTNFNATIIRNVLPYKKKFSTIPNSGKRN